MDVINALCTVLLKTENDLCHRKELSGTEKNFYLLFLCYFKTCLRTFNIIVVLISDCIIVFALKFLIKIS